MSNVWFITGAGRGLGLYITKAALAAGHQVVATGRDPAKVEKAIGASDNLLVVRLDVTNAAEAAAAAKSALDRFGRVDVLVNNAASFYAGYFEEQTAEDIQLQLATSLHGPMNVTRALLPAMRQAGTGRVVSISSTAGITGFEFNSAYSASKFALDGWMEALSAEVAPFGIQTMIVNPGFFRTELLTDASTQYSAGSIEAYADRRAQRITFYKSMNGKQGGDPAKLAQALLLLTERADLPARFIAGADAIDVAQQKVSQLQQQIDAYRELSQSLAHD